MDRLGQKKMVNIAIVGCGYWGPNLIRTFGKLDQCKVTMCCDLDQARLRDAEKLAPGAVMTTSYEEVLNSKNVDAVALATPVRTHLALGKTALQRGKHLLVEKPLAVTPDQCQEMIEQARKNNLVLMVGHTFLYSPALIKVKELATPDLLGDILHIHSQRLNLGRVQTDINALWSLAPHDVSIALHLLEQMPDEVSASGTSVVTKGIEDIVSVQLTFSGGASASIHVSWLDPEKVRKLKVIGSKRMIVYDDMSDEEKVKVYDKSANVVASKANPAQTQVELRSGEVSVHKVAASEPLANECAHFIQCIQEGKRPLSDGENGLKVVRVLDAANQSLKNHSNPVLLNREAVKAL